MPPAQAMPSGQGGARPAGRKRDAAWLAHLQLLAGLPYAPMTIAPALLDTLVAGFDADYADFFWRGRGGDPSQPDPVDMYNQCTTEAVQRWTMQHTDAFTVLAPFGEQVRTDGDHMRALASDPAYLRSAAYRNAMEPLGGRWMMGVPLLSPQGECQGYLYLQRDGSRPAFSDAEQARLRRARDRLTALGSRSEAADGTLPRLAVCTALLRFDAQGQMRARSAQALGLLLRCHEEPLQEYGRWTASDLSALPHPLREQVRRMLRDADVPAQANMRLEHHGSLLELRAERLLDEQGGPEVLVAISQLEPLDLAVAREIHDWPLAPHEKQLIVASTRPCSQRELAEQLGCTVGTLKGYLNRLFAKLGVVSREELMAQLL